jgi:hypothetical protein
VRDPRARFDRLGYLGNRAVRDAEENEIRTTAVELAPRGARWEPLAEPCGHCLADASGADDAR